MFIAHLDTHLSTKLQGLVLGTITLTATVLTHVSALR